MPNRSVIVSGLFAFACYAACATGASAQAPSPSPAPLSAPKPAAPAAPATPAASPSPTATPYKLITLSGYGDAAFTSVLGTDAARLVNGTPSRIFDAATGPFFDANGGRLLAPANDFNTSPNLQNANVQLTLNGPFISAKIEQSFGTDADVIASNGQSRSGVNLTQAYLQAVRGQFTLLAGKFSTLAGAEVIEAPGNTNVSRSYLFGEAIPFTHTGLRLTYAYNSKIALVGGINNGWDDWKFAGKKKTFEGALQLTPSPGYALTLDTYNGNDFAVTGTSDLGILPVYTNRMLYDAVLTLHPTSALTLIANYDRGTQLGDPRSGFATSRWNGFAGYATYQFNPLYALSLRSETFHDTDGFRTGIAQRQLSNTATLSYTPNANLVFRGEFRADAADGNNFTFRRAAPGGGRPHQTSLAIETIVKFP
ncbi:MAG: hypothetical protein NVSMB19_01970 [Vulcanimicrobiaceae bacterium]